MKIGQRLALSYALLLLFLAAVLMVSVNRLASMSQITHEVVTGDAARVALANQINLQAEAAAERLLLLFILEDRELRVEVYKEIDQRHAMIEQAIQQLTPLLDSAEQNPALARVVERRKRFEEHFTATVEALETGDRAAAVRLMTGETRGALKALLEETAALAKTQQASMESLQKQAARTAEESKYVVLALGFGALIAGLIMAVAITRGISRPLGAAVISADLIAQGDLVKAVPKGGRDEIGRLFAGMAHMRDQLREIIGAIHQSAQQVGQAAATLGRPASNVEQGSLDQGVLAGRIEESVRTLTLGIGEMVTHVQISHQPAQSARDMAEKNARAIIVVADEIARIAITIAESAASVQSLDESAKEVAGTVGVIKDIANQTNLLALNAAIEAARAGESGRGFAVVADEVRKLANHTADATSQIDQVIARINGQTATAVRDIDEGRKGMERGRALIKDIVGPLDELRQGAQLSLDSLERLLDIAKAQANESQAIAANVAEIVGMASGNQRAAAEVVAITNDLVGLSADLEKSVGAFRL